MRCSCKTIRLAGHSAVISEVLARSIRMCAKLAVTQAVLIMNGKRSRFRNVVRRQGPSRVSDTRSERAASLGGSLEQRTSSKLTNFAGRLYAQRRETENLLARSALLRSRCLLRRTETRLLCEEIGHFCKTLAATFTSIERLRYDLCGSLHQGDSDCTDLESITAPRDLVGALEDATEILRMEFLETEGSGRETLVKCEDALRKAQSIRTFILPLY